MAADLLKKGRTSVRGMWSEKKQAVYDAAVILCDTGGRYIDFKLEFGRYKGEIVLADEISPDTCRFWDSKTGEKLDKDRFRRDLGGVEEAYEEILRRLMGA